ncbi:hypothetical protein M513_03783 [Trichuris suis]|uniref:Uncharacterized protein n=2 Tax=Trichuris suis TaxID=68888 RepID=A0A085MDZ7_9BILA|nr:hypothetical protein M513_03783 [Trichuris suis]
MRSQTILNRGEIVGQFQMSQVEQSIVVNIVQFQQWYGFFQSRFVDHYHKWISHPFRIAKTITNALTGSIVEDDFSLQVGKLVEPLRYVDSQTGDDSLSTIHLRRNNADFVWCNACRPSHLLVC